MTTDHDHQDVLDLIDAALAPDDYPTAAERDDLLEAWKIDGERTALWATTKLRRAYERRIEAAVTAEKLRAMADQHVAQIEHDTDHDVRYFTGKLREYHYAEVAGSKRKTTTLPDGTKLVSRAGSVSTDVDAEREAELVAFLEDHTTEIPDAVQYPPPRVMASKIKSTCDGKVDAEPGEYPAVIPDTGEVVPAIAFVRGEPTFAVNLGDLDTDE